MVLEASITSLVPNGLFVPPQLEGWVGVWIYIYTAQRVAFICCNTFRSSKIPIRLVSNWQREFIFLEIVCHWPITAILLGPSPQHMLSKFPIFPMPPNVLFPCDFKHTYVPTIDRQGKGMINPYATKVFDKIYYQHYFAKFGLFVRVF